MVLMNGKKTDILQIPIFIGQKAKNREKMTFCPLPVFSLRHKN